MKKILVYIDFEAITAPFNKEAGIINDFPYAYTIGIYLNEKFKTRTYIFNFKNSSTKAIYQIIKSHLISDIKKLLDNKIFEISAESVKFVGWSPILEKKILNKIFKSIVVERFNQDFELSLSRLTPEIKKDYFNVLKKNIYQNLDHDFIKRRGLDADGALAALAGFILWAKANNYHNKYALDIDLKVLIKELKKYSKDDVLRIDFLNRNKKLYHHRKHLALSLIAKKQTLIKKIYKKNKTMEVLVHENQDKTVKEIISDLKNDIEKLHKNKLKLEKDLENIKKH